MRAAPALRGLALAWLLAAGSAFAQEEIQAPITAKAVPEVALPGGAITLSGDTPKLLDGTQVSVEIRLDNSAGGDAAAPLTLQARVDGKGHWTLSLKGDTTAAAGRYTVRAVAPDGKGEATTQFTIVEGEALGELAKTYAEDMNRSLDLTEAAIITQLTDLTLGLAAGPEKDAMVVSVNKIVQKLRELRKFRATPLPSLPPPPPVAPGQAPWPPIDYTQVLGTYRAITDESDRVRKQLLKSRAKTDNCLRMDSLIESLNFTSSLTNFIGDKLTIAVNLLSDKVMPAIVERNMAPSTQAEKNRTAAVITAVKANIASHSGWNGLAGAVPGLFLDALNHRTKAFYERFCKRYEGAFTATMTVQNFAEDGSDSVYWSYTTRLGGLASLTEPKPGKGQVEGRDSLLRGRFDGAAIGYDTYQDALKLNPKLRQMLVYEQLIAPPKTIWLPPVEMGAMFNALTSPVGFQVPITAERSADKVTVNLGDAIRDMDPKINRGLLVQVFQAGPIPAPNYQVFPMQDAQFILSRGMRKNAVLTRESTAQGDKLTGTFHREETPPGVRVVWDVQVEMCSPACSSTTIDRLKAWYEAGRAKAAAAPR